MKKLIFSLLLALVAVGANAQGFGGGQFRMNPEDMAKHQADRVKEACSTTDDQYKQIYELYLAQSVQMDSIMKAGMQGGDRPRFDREKMMANRNAMNEKIKAILTPEQYAKYEEQQKHMMERMRQR